MAKDKNGDWIRDELGMVIPTQLSSMSDIRDEDENKAIREDWERIGGFELPTDDIQFDNDCMPILTIDDTDLEFIQSLGYKTKAEFKEATDDVSRIELYGHNKHLYTGEDLYEKDENS